jgi:cyclophilin family peptidyl-prolyl cis-trans isomerase
MMKSIRLPLFILLALLMQGVFAAEAGTKDTLSESSPQVGVVFETTMGSFTLELYPDKAPKTVTNFLTYVDEGFYDNTIFHRVIPDFVIQGGGFEAGMKYKEPRAPVKNESSNRLKNSRGTISMARRSHPDTATSQFYINLSHNDSLDYISKYQPGYTVFGRISKGMDVIDKISVVGTTTVGRSNDVPKDDVVILSVKRKASMESVKDGKNADEPEQKQEQYIAGEHYVVLDRPVPTRDNRKIEVVEMFTYGCPHCYEFEPLIKGWSKQQAGDVDFWYFPAVWNEPMKLYARAFYAANELNVSEKIHLPLFNAIVIEQKSIRNEADLADIFESHGVDRKDFTEVFNSTETETQVKYAEERVRLYKPVGVPEIIVNGKYRVDRMRAGGLKEMLAVADYLINKERATLKK